METMIVEREQALWLIAGLLAEYSPNTKIQVAKFNGGIAVHPQSDQSDLLQWAERIGNKYDDVFKHLAES